MNWNDAPEADKADWEALRETPEKRRQNAANALRIMESERGTDQAADPAALEREIARTRKIAEEPLPNQPVQVAQKPVQALAWDQAPEVPEETWMNAPEVREGGYVAAAKSGIPLAWANLKQTIGGMIRSMGEPQRSPLEPGAPVPFGQEAFAALSERSNVAAEQQAASGKPFENPAVAAGKALQQSGEETAAENIPEDLTFGQRAVMNAVSSTLTMLPGLAASIATRSAAPAVGAAAAMQQAQSYGEIRDKRPDISPEQAAAHANIDAAAEGIFEFLPMNFLVKHAGGPILKTFVGTLMREVPTEALTTAVQSANAKLTTRPDMTLEDYMMDIADTVAATAISTPLLAGGARVMSPLGRRVAENEAAGIPLTHDPAVDNWVDQANNGNVNSTLTSPSFDFPTAQLDAAEHTQLEQNAAAVEAPSLTEEQANKAKESVAQYEKQLKAPALPGAELAWAQLSTAPSSPMEDASELGASARSAANAENYLNPNTGDRLDRQITFATDEGAVGLTPRQIAPKPGVYVLGIPSEDRPADYLGAQFEQFAQWQQEYMPDATIVLSNEQLWSNGALGWHYTTGAKGHMVVPATLRLRGRTLDEYNRNAQASAFYNASHEFGHALIEHSFFREMPDEVVTALRDQAREGAVAADLVTKLPAPQAAVVAEFNALKQRILDGSMTAAEFVQQWMGPAKIARKTFLEDLKVAPEAPAMQLVRAIARRSAERSNITNEASADALYQQQVRDFTSLEEYLAEQMARHAYKQNWDQKSPLGQFFSKALTSLRKFFVDQKKNEIIAPGTAFADWVRGLSRTEQALEAKRLQTEAKKAIGKMATAKKAPKQKAATTTQKTKRTEANAKSDPTPERQHKARGMITQLVRHRVLQASDQQYKDLLAAVRRGDFEEFVELYHAVSGKAVRFEIDETTPQQKVTALPKWQQEKFSAPSFKAWFGDWETSPEESSKARIGIVSIRGGTITLDNERPAPPLVVFANLAKLQQGQNHFHASTTLGQHYEDATNPLQNADEKGLVPVVLNVRNPYVVEPGQSHAPSRAELQAQGFDGILYLNDLDGDSSWIVFSPEQIKIVPDRRPYSGRTFMELDHDSSQADGEGSARIFRGVKDFVADSKAVRKALRWANKASLYGLQMSHLAHIHPELSELSFWSRANLYYNLYKSSRQAEPNRILRDWEKLPFDDRQKVTKFLLQEFESGEHWFALEQQTKEILDEGQKRNIPWWTFVVNERTLQKFAEFGIDLHSDRGRATGEMIARVKNNMHLDKLNEDERVMRRIAAHRYAKPAVYDAYVQGLAYDIHQMRLKPWIPQTRFGKFVMTIQKRNAKGKWETAHNEGFESQEELTKAVAKAKAKATSEERVIGKERTEKSLAMLSLPSDFLDVASSELNLEPDQVADLMEILQPVRKEKILRDYDMKRLGLKGYSTDLMRSFANHSWHHANLQAKMRYRTQFKLAEGQLRQRIAATETSGDVDSTIRLQQLLKHMQDTTEYVMNPPNEMYLARALVTYVYLWGNVKTALLNVSGLMTTYTSAQQRFGSLDGERRFQRAVLRTGASVWLSRGKQLPMPPMLQQALERAVEEGVLSQSYAYHLAGYANQTTLPKRSQKWSRRFIDLGMAPFRMMELFTRRVSFLMEMEAALEKHGKEAFEPAYEEAVRRTNLTQNDYSLGNRIKLMRGTGPLGALKPMVTIFGSFAQHMSFHSLGGFELGERRAARLEAAQSGEPNKGPRWYNSYTGRLALMLFALGGIEGLPLAENMIDIAEYFWRLSKHPIPLRQYMREYARAINIDPWLFMRGLGHDVSGFDISRSIGMGRVIPGTDVLAKNSDGSFAEDTGNAILDVAGVFGSFIKWIGEVKSGISSGNWLKVGTKAPGEVGNLFSAYDWAENGLRGPKGGRILRDENGVLRDPTQKEIFGKILGLNPTAVSEAKERGFRQSDQLMFWMTKRKGLISEYHEAWKREDKEGMAQAKQKIAEHNSWISDEYPEFRQQRISPSDLARNRQRWRQERRAEERGELPGRKNRPLSESVNRSYERPEGGD